LDTLVQQIINGLSLGSVYALIAVGYSLVYSILLFSNFSHGGFIVIGGYICYYTLAAMGNNIWLSGFTADEKKTGMDPMSISLLRSTIAAQMKLLSAPEKEPAPPATKEPNPPETPEAEKTPDQK